MHRTSQRVDRLLLAVICVVLIAARSAIAAPPTSHPALTVIDNVWHDANRQRDVPVRLYLPANTSKPAAAILVSHGLGDSRASMAFACRAWAARGLVVVALQHPGSDESVWRDAKPADRFTAVFRAASPQQFAARCEDVKFALDEVARRNEGTGKLKGRIDLDRLGIAGHSFGSLTAQAIIGQQYAPQPGLPETFADDRIKAAVLMSPGIEGVTDFNSAFANVRVPVIHFTGTADVVAGLGVTTASKRRVPFDRINASDQYLVIFDRGDHIVFSGHRPYGVNEQRYDRIEAATAQLSADFFQAYLHNDAAAEEMLVYHGESLGETAKFEHKQPATAPAQ